MNLNKQKINKFYVGAADIAAAIDSGSNTDWTHKTEEAAVNHAKRIIRNEDRECVIIVQITHVIKRADQPIQVYKIK